MNIIVSFLLVRCFMPTLVLGFPLQLSTPPRITKYYKQQNMRECKYVEEVGFIIEPDFAGRDSVQVVQELDILTIFEDTDSSSPTSWCDYSTLLYWLCSAGRDVITNSFPDIHLPIQSSHRLNESECFFLSEVCYILNGHTKDTYSFVSESSLLAV